MTRRLNLWLAWLLVIGGSAFWWLLLENSPGDARPMPLHIAQLRALAASLPGPAPTSVEGQVVMVRFLPGDALAAGIGLKRRPLATVSFRLTVPGGKPILIDSGITAADARAEAGLRSFDPAGQAAIERALPRAGMILFTNELADHLGAAVALAARPGGSDLLARMRLSAAQLPPMPLPGRLAWPRPPLPRPAIAPGAPQALAPGVVVIPAPGHTPGSQMIFVRLAGGRELLFTGDTAPLTQSWTQLRARSRLVGDLYDHENRRAIFAWLGAIGQLHREAPALQVIPGHDYEAIGARMVAGSIASRFTPDPPAARPR